MKDQKTSKNKTYTLQVNKLYLVGDQVFSTRKSAELAYLTNKLDNHFSGSRGIGYPAIVEIAIDPVSDDSREDYLVENTRQWNHSDSDMSYKKGMGMNWKWAK